MCQNLNIFQVSKTLRFHSTPKLDSRLRFLNKYLRGIKRAIPRKVVKISDCRVPSFFKTLPGCRVSRQFIVKRLFLVAVLKLVIFPVSLTINSETFLQNLSSLKELRNYGDRWEKLLRVRKDQSHRLLLFADWPEKISSGYMCASWNIIT